MTHKDKWYFSEQALSVFRKAGKAQVNLASEAAQQGLVEELLPILEDILENYSPSTPRNGIGRMYGTLR